MPVDPLRLLAICRDIEETLHEGLRSLDRETVLATQKVLKALKREVDRTLLRLSFVDEQQLNQAVAQNTPAVGVKVGVPISATAARYAQKAEQILRLRLLFQPFCLIAEKLFPDALALGNLRQINFRRLPAMMRAGRTSRPPKASAIGCEACQPSEDQDGAWRAANHDRWEQFEKRR